MQKSLKSCIIALGLVAGIAGLKVYAEEMKKVAPMGKEVVWPADQLQFKDVMPGIKRAVLWGDPATGKYGSVTKFDAGIKHALHTHSSDIKIVVISGMFVYGADGKETHLGAGSYLLIPANKQHNSGTDAGSDCTFFEESPGKFTMTMVK